MAHARNLSGSPKLQNTKSYHRQLSHKCIVRLCGGCSELAEAEAQVVVAQNVLETARKRLARAKTNLNDWHDRLVVRLPPEIVSRIFVFFSWSDGGFKERDGYTYNSLCTSLLLASVCQKWRGIALATPQLWTDVDIDISKHSTQPDITQDLLSRSRSLPLNLTFYYQGSGGFENPSISLDPLFNVIRSHSARWKYLDFENVWHQDMTPQHTLLDKLFHNLESIPISDCLELHLADVPVSLHPIFLPEPLRPRIFHSQTDPHKPSIPLRWDNLTHLKAESFSVRNLLDIVRHAPRLTDWTSDNTFYLEDQALTFPITPIIHRSLKNLTLISDVNDHNILRHLTFPSLNHLECAFVCFDNLVLDNLIDFLDRSDLKPGTLQTFHLQYDVHGEDYDHRFVELMALTHLHVFIRDTPSTSAALQSYLCQFSAAPLLPHLRHLKIELLHGPEYGRTIVSAPCWALLSELCREEDPAIGSYISPSGVIERRGHRRPLEFISVPNCARPDVSTMEKDVLLRFLEVQGAGVVKLDFRDQHNHDVLKTMASNRRYMSANISRTSELEHNSC